MSIRSLCVSLGLLLTLCDAALAQDEGPYLGVGIGQSKVANPPSCLGLSGLFDPGYSCKLTDTDIGWKIFGGYQANRYAAFEVSYVDLGAAKRSASGTVTLFLNPPSPVAASTTFAASGFSFDLVLNAPITEGFSLSGRAGVFAWTLKNYVSASAGSPTSMPSKSSPGYSFDFGVGARYDFSRNVGVRVEFQRFLDVGDNNNTGKSDFDLISASLVYTFR